MRLASLWAPRRPPTPKIGNVMWGIYYVLVVFGVAIVIGAVSFVWDKRAEVRRDLAEKAHSLSIQLDSDLRRIAQNLQTMSLSSEFQSGNLGAIERYAMQALPHLGGNNIALFDLSGSQVLNTIPGDLPVYKSTLFTLAMERFASKPAPLFGPLTWGPKNHSWVLAVAVPWYKAGKLNGVIALVMLPEQVNSILKQYELPPGAASIAVDWQGTVIGRSTERRGSFIGDRLEQFMRDIGASRAGFWEGNSLAGIPAITAYERSELTRYIVRVGMFQSEFYAPMYWAIATAALLVFILIVVGWYEHRLISQMETGFARLAAQVQAFERDHAVEPQGTGFVELDDAERAIATTMARALKYIHEVNHRSRNVLTKAQAVIRLARRGEKDPTKALNRVEAGITFLARVTDLLLKHDMRGADIQEIVDVQAVSLHGQRVRTTGGRIPFMSSDVESLSMIIHELTTNALKYGALNSDQAPHGTIDVSWHMAQARCTIVWRELGVNVIPSEREGEGTKLIDHVTESELKGTVVRHFEPDGIHVVLEFPYVKPKDLP